MVLDYVIFKPRILRVKLGQVRNMEIEYMSWQLRLGYIYGCYCRNACPGMGPQHLYPYTPQDGLMAGTFLLLVSSGKVLYKMYPGLIFFSSYALAVLRRFQNKNIVTASRYLSKCSTNLRGL